MTDVRCCATGEHFARTFPLDGAAAANALLESGTVIGNLVLLTERPRGPSI